MNEILQYGLQKKKKNRTLEGIMLRIILRSVATTNWTNKYNIAILIPNFIGKYLS